MKLDYLIIGSGLAGIAFCEQLYQHNKTFVVIDDHSQKASTVAGGLYNPVILKRFTKVWKAREQLQLAMPFYRALEEKFKTQFDHKIPVYRLFASVEEQNNWFQACDDKVLSEFLSTNLMPLNNDQIECEFGFGKVLQTGRIDTALLISTYKDHLAELGQLIRETFRHDQLEFNDDSVKYGSLQVAHVVFAEGFGLKLNPYFNDLPLDGTKGELLTIHAPELKIDYVLKSSVFLIPIGHDLYRVGATYEWTDKTNEPTEKAKDELLMKLDKFIKCDYDVVTQVAGIRPTVKDRRPLVGQHRKHKQLFVLNGLGSRGVMIAPYVSKQLFKHIEEGRSLDTDIDIKRFDRSGS